jgi:hypothetical protein
VQLRICIAAMAVLLWCGLGLLSLRRGECDGDCCVVVNESGYRRQGVAGAMEHRGAVAQVERNTNRAQNAKVRASE